MARGMAQILDEVVDFDFTLTVRYISNVMHLPDCCLDHWCSGSVDAPVDTDFAPDLCLPASGGVKKRPAVAARKAQGKGGAGGGAKAGGAAKGPMVRLFLICLSASWWLCTPCLSALRLTYSFAVCGEQQELHAGYVVAVLLHAGIVCIAARDATGTLVLMLSHEWAEACVLILVHFLNLCVVVHLQFGGKKAKGMAKKPWPGKA